MGTSGSVLSLLPVGVPGNPAGSQEEQHRAWVQEPPPPCPGSVPVILYPSVYV